MNKNTLRYLLRFMLPFALRRNFFTLRTRKSRACAVRNFIETAHNSKSIEMREISAFLSQNGYSQLPYEFTKKYKPENIVVYADTSCGMRYVFHQNKKLYFPRYMRKPEVQDYYNILLMEQDAESPHLYETEKFFVKAGDIIADIGAAEGIWALSNVEKAKKVYIFECEIHWLEALKKTFEPWQDRISIVNKYVSNVSMSSTGGGGGIITIDDFFSDKKIDFIKADIEGNEPFMLQGAKNLLTRNNLCIAICAYHNDADAGIITKILSNTGFTLEFSKGYILLQDNNTLCLSPRKGIIRAYKKQL